MPIAPAADATGTGHIIGRGNRDDSPDVTRKRLRIAGNAAISRAFASAASLRSPVGSQLQHPGLEPVLPLSLRVLPPELLDGRLLPQFGRSLLPISGRNAHPGVQQHLAQLLSRAD